MLMGLKQWMLRAVNEAAMQQNTAGKVDRMIHRDRPPQTSVMDVVDRMSNSMAAIYRIDNGFLLCINMTSEAHLGARGSLVYAKDAEELAQKIVAYEAAFKMGIHGQGDGSVRTPNGIVGAAMSTQYAPKI